MAGKKDRKKMREELRKRREEQKKRETGGGGIFRNDLEDVSFWKCPNGDHEIDIIPYVAGESGPVDKEGNLLNPEGAPAYVLEVSAHYIQDKGYFICPRIYDGSPCPVCEEHDRLQKEGADDGELKKLRPSKRVIYNVIVYDEAGKEEEKGVQIWHASEFLAERKFRALAEKGDRKTKNTNDTYIYFFDPDDGRTIGFECEGKNQNLRYNAHRFISRDYVIDDDILESAHCLEELIKVLSYEKLYELFWGEVAGTDDDDDDPEPRKRRGKKSDPDEDEDKPKKRRGKKSEPDEDEEPDDDPDEDEEQDEDEDSDEDEEPDDEPKKRRGRGKKVEPKSKKRRGKKKVEPDEDEESDDEPKKRRGKKKAGENKCPAGYEFGADCDEKEGCEECPEKTWEACADAQEADD